MYNKHAVALKTIEYEEKSWMEWYDENHEKTVVDISANIGVAQNLHSNVGSKYLLAAGSKGINIYEEKELKYTI